MGKRGYKYGKLVDPGLLNRHTAWLVFDRLSVMSNQPEREATTAMVISYLCDGAFPKDILQVITFAKQKGCITVKDGKIAFLKDYKGIRDCYYSHRAEMYEPPEPAQGPRTMNDFSAMFRAALDSGGK